MATIWDARFVEFDKSDYSAVTRANIENIFTDNDVWEPVRLLNETYNKKGGVRLLLHVKRKPEAYYSIFLPAFQLNLLQVSVFFMPAESSDRPDFSVTVFLSSSVLLGLFSTNLPPSAEVLYLQINLGIQISFGVFITIWVLISNRLATSSRYFKQKAKGNWFFFGKRQLKRIDVVDGMLFIISIAAYIVMDIVTYTYMSAD